MALVNNPTIAQGSALAEAEKEEQKQRVLNAVRMLYDEALGVEEGMGIIHEGHATAKELGPDLGRGMGMTMREKPVSNMVGMDMTGMAVMDKKQVPGFPQDMWMPMNEAVAKPETYGLAPGWSGAVTGMMTLVRILPPDKYEKKTSSSTPNRR